MLRAIVERFLEIASEREFDGPLLALLSTEGFTDVHFAHGSFEFGKDVIAKRVDADGVLRQYCIQSKAGDINHGSWREVRPQLEEAEYNTRVHPGYDAALPRVAVLVTTGRLKGAAGVDAQEFAQAAASRGLATFEVWDREKFIAWICESPSVGLAGSDVQTDFLRVVTAIRDGSVSEHQIEQYTRGWVESAGSVRPWVECAIIVAELTDSNRLDLAAYVALDLLRAGHFGPAQTSIAEDVPGRLFRGIGIELLTLVEPLLASPIHLANASMKTSGFISYPVVCCRLAEIFALLSLWAAQGGDDELTLRSRGALQLMVAQPGSRRPPSDAFAASVIAATLALSQVDPAGARDYLRSVAEWLLDRYDATQGGLGLGAVYEDERTAIVRLLGGSLDFTTLERRPSSYLATAVLDLCVYLGHGDLYEAVRSQLESLRVTPESTAADEQRARWSRSGNGTWPRPRVEFLAWELERATLSGERGTYELAVELSLTSACRSRHRRDLWMPRT